MIYSRIFNDFWHKLDHIFSLNLLIPGQVPNIGNLASTHKKTC